MHQFVSNLSPISIQLLIKPYQVGLLANGLIPTVGQMQSVQLIQVNLISAHCLDQESLELD